MKKYKLQCDDLLKNEICRAKGLNSNFKIKGSLLALSTAACLATGLSSYNNRVTNYVGILATGMVAASGISIVKSGYDVNSSLYRLEKLKLSLLESNLYVDFDNTEMISNCIVDDITATPLCIMDKDANFSINCDSDSVIYRDDSGDYDITDNVMKSLLNKRDYKKYLKSSEN